MGLFGEKKDQKQEQQEQQKAQSSGYWGLDEEGGIVCLVAVFMNPEYF